MSDNAEDFSVPADDANNHQPAYIFTPSANEDEPEPPAKKRKIGRGKRSSGATLRNAAHSADDFKFESLFDGAESPECVALRQELFTCYWGETEHKIQSILNDANDETLVKVTSFVDNAERSEAERVPTAFIATGPNIASQSLLFKQLSARLRTDISGPVVNLRSGDASNLKALLKQVIRDATNQTTTDDDEELALEQDGRKYLNYDLEILYNHVKIHSCQKVVIAFQDSEAFDPSILADVIILFNSWTDRIPFTLLFGIATSVDLFYERLPRAASRCLYGTQFDVEQTSTILETVFQRVIACPDAPLRLGPKLVSGLVERQHDHVQSVQAFISALKYAYMCHFYANPLTILCDGFKSPQKFINLLQPLHFQAFKMLPSFKRMIEEYIEDGDPETARTLLDDDSALQDHVVKALGTSQTGWMRLLQRMHILNITSKTPIGTTEVYLKVFKGSLGDSDLVREVLDSVKRMDPDAIVSLVNTIQEAIQNGCPAADLNGWAKTDLRLLKELSDITEKVVAVVEAAAENGKPLRSSYSAHSQGLRTTVIAQKVQLSYEKSSLSKEDIEFTKLVDRLSKTLKQYFDSDSPQTWFLNEVWLYDSLSPYTDVFAPHPRYALERALSTPSDYLPACDADIDISSTKPPTAIVYQMYLESGSLVNISDIWEAFLSHTGCDETEGYSERTALMLLYRGLSDLKLLGMVKQSKKKTDHIAKTSWKGL